MSSSTTGTTVAGGVREARTRWRSRSASGDEADARIATLLERTVVRPLLAGRSVEDGDDTAGVPGTVGTDGTVGTAGTVGPVGAGTDDDLAALVDLAVALAEAAASDPRAELVEACAGALRVLELGRLLDLADVPADHRSARLAAALAAIPSGPTGRVTVVADGPYLAVGPAATGMATWLGEPVDAPPVAALCRCGRSGSKPFCDGTHAEIGFSGAKHPDRIPDRRDLYEARQFEITDNRGLCAHSGRCTDALPVVFRVGTEPFVAPAGGGADDILRAVQACPSGALGAALEGRRAASLADTRREPGIEVSKDGPYRLTGGVEVVEPDGAPVPRPEGASPEHCSLCRCGRSTNKPFCSGAHWNADFHDPVVAMDEDPTLFAWAGGYPALLRTTRLFYERHVAADDLLAPLFSRMEPDHPERVAAWLSEVFGGPELYSQRYGGYARMISQHIGKHLTETQRARWITLLVRSADEADLPADPEFRAAFAAYLEWGTRIAVENSTDGARPPEGMPIPHWWWVCNATPSARASALPAAAPEGAPAVETPAPEEAVSFERHVRGLFRPRDRGSMRSTFDLWSHDDVTTHADAILGRLRDGSMPCDGAWPADRLAVLDRWIQDGCRA
jgi:CDGSH-type Zn-finger protein/truncated hemoglobin YjbI